MKKEEIKYFCDTCKEETNEKDCFRVNYPVIFTTNQTDGVSSKPDIEQMQIDICRHCAEKVLKITASGCQGYNEYKIINEDTKWQKLKEWLDLAFQAYFSESNKNAIETIGAIMGKMQELESENE